MLKLLAVNVLVQVLGLGRAPLLAARTRKLTLTPYPRELERSGPELHASRGRPQPLRLLLRPQHQLQRQLQSQLLTQNLKALQLAPFPNPVPSPVVALEGAIKPAQKPPMLMMLVLGRCASS